MRNVPKANLLTLVLYLVISGIPYKLCWQGYIKAELRVEGNGLILPCLYQITKWADLNGSPPDLLQDFTSTKLLRYDGHFKPSVLPPLQKNTAKRIRVELHRFVPRHFIDAVLVVYRSNPQPVVTLLQKKGSPKRRLKIHRALTVLLLKVRAFQCRSKLRHEAFSVKPDTRYREVRATDTRSPRLHISGCLSCGLRQTKASSHLVFNPGTEHFKQSLLPVRNVHIGSVHFLLSRMKSRKNRPMGDRQMSLSITYSVN